MGTESARRRPPRTVTLVLFFGLILVAIWRLRAWSIAPPSLPGAPGSAAISATASALAAPLRPTPPWLTLAPLSSAEARDEAAEDAGSFEGRVVDAITGAPIPAASLSVAHAGGTIAVTADREGAFAFDAPMPGTYRLAHVAAEGFVPFAPAWGESPIAWQARKGAVVSGITIALHPDRPFVIEVRNAAGDPVPQAIVRALAPRTAKPLAPTNDDGETVGSVAEGALLEARHSDHGVGRARVSWLQAAGHRVTITLQKKGSSPWSDPVAAIAGRVVGSAGNGLGDVRVVALPSPELPAAEGAQLLVPGDDTTDPDGSFRVDGLDAGPYELVAIASARDGSGASLAPARAHVIAPASEVELRMLGGATVRGVVRDAATDRPIAAFTIVALRHVDALRRDQAAASAFVDATGAYALTGLGPGRYDLIAAAAGFAESAPATFSIPDPPADPTPIDFRLTLGGSLHGKVTDAATTEAIAGAHIEVEAAIGGESGPIAERVISSDAEGMFTITGLKEGVRSIVVSAKDHHGRVRSRLKILEGQTSEVNIALTPVEDGETPRIELVGIGAVLSAKGDALVLGQVIAGGGAAEAGLVPGDRILAVDGVEVVKVGFPGAIERIRGPEGSTVLLLVARAVTSAAPPEPVLVSRRSIAAPP